MRPSPIIAIFAGMMCSVVSGAASAQQSLDFSYNFGNGNVMSGVLTGTDAGNYFTVTGVQSFLVNGTDESTYFTQPSIYSKDSFNGFGSGYNNNGTAVVTLDGSYMDIIVLGSQISTFQMGVNDVTASQYGSFAEYELDVDNNGPGAGGTFSASDWTASLASASVPEPAAAAVFLAGLFGLSIVHTRQGRSIWR
jgi:hypothetical protein